MDPSGKTALLTGATGGLGRAIARELAEHGATVVLSGRSAEALTDLAAELPGDGHRVAPSDLSEPGAAVALASEAADADLLIANAGLPGSGRLDSFSHAELERVLRVNLEAPILLARELAPKMVERGLGQLVFVASLAGKAATARSSLYNATKFGLRGFALALRQDLAGTGVGVSLVSPGFIREAGLFHDSGARLPPGIGTRSPEDVARAVAKAIERDSLEVDVAPLPLRLSAELALLAPGIAAKIAAAGGGHKLADKFAAGQQDKR